MPDSKYFGVPFGSSGDREVIPEASQPSGVVSYQQGFGPDYERNPATDPLAKRVPRDGTNEFYYQLSNSVKFLQLYGLPEWYQNDDGGNRVSYPIAARVRYGGAAYISLVANNLATPGSDATKWALDEAFSVAALEASLAEMLAGTIGTKLATPRRVAASVQRGAWNFAVAGGTANALTATLAPAPEALTAGMIVFIKATIANTGSVTLNLNGLGATPVISNISGTALMGGEIGPNKVLELLYDGAAFRFLGIAFDRFAKSGAFGVGGSLGPVGTTMWTVPPGVTRVKARVWGAGGGGGGSVAYPSAAAGGGGGGYTEGIYTVVPGQQIAVTAGAAGAGGSGGNTNPGATGGTSSFGTYSTGVGGGGGGSAPTGVYSTAVGAGGMASHSQLGGTIEQNGLPGSPGVNMENAGLGGGGGPSWGSQGGHPGDTAGRPGMNPGGGGAGGANGQGGGGGGNGVVILEW